MRTLDEIRVFLKEDHFAFDLCGIVIEAVGDGTARCSMKLEKKHLNANGVVQGGAIFTLADICFCVAANSAGGVMVSQSAEIHYLRPGTGSWLYAEAQRIHEGRTTGLFNVDVFDDQGRRVACASVTGFRIQRTEL